MIVPQNTPQKSLEDAIMKSDLPQLAEDYGELIVDSVMDDGILKEIPILKTIISCIKFTNSLSKHYAAKKIYKFLFQLKSIPKEKREKKINEINTSKRYQSTVGEFVLEILDKIESEGKPEIIGRLFGSFLEEKLTFEEFLRISHIVQTAFYFDLLKLINYDENDYLYEGNTEQLSSLGLSSFGYNAWGKPEPKENCSGEISELGKNLVIYGLQKKKH